MTIAPYAPRFKESGTPGIRVLLEDHKTVVKLFSFIGLEITILAGLLTDGASIPQKLQIVAGGPWAMPRLLAAIVHDALYAAHWFCRWACDVIYWLVRRQFGEATKIPATVEYTAIRVGGKSAWKEKTPEGIEAARKLLKIRLVFFPDPTAKIAAALAVCCILVGCRSVTVENRGQDYIRNADGTALLVDGKPVVYSRGWTVEHWQHWMTTKADSLKAEVKEGTIKFNLNGLNSDPDGEDLEKVVNATGSAAGKIIGEAAKAAATL